MLLATGAFAALGDFNITSLLLTATSASVVGDAIGYWIGRKAGPPILSWLSTQKVLRFIKAQTVKRAEEHFRRRAGLAVFASRCLIPSLGGVINILAGAERYTFRNFLILDICGEAMSAALPLLLGFAFGASWEAIGKLMTQISTLILILSITIYLTILLIRTVRKMVLTKAQATAATMTIVQEKTKEGALTRLRHQHKRREPKKKVKKVTFPATLRRLQTYKSTDGLHTGYGFPSKTTSNPGRRD
jgi:membrane-associated protein